MLLYFLFVCQCMQQSGDVVLFRLVRHRTLNDLHHQTNLNFLLREVGRLNPSDVVKKEPHKLVMLVTLKENVSGML